ncbi:MAG: sugar kinase [Chloroflexi bacterium]|nr:sugar kinase [Chloroflexota bacterium]
MTVLVAGWVAIDEIETPFAKVSDALGGSALAAALAASLFTDVRLLAAVGEDFPERHRATLEKTGIDLAGLTVEPGTTSRWGGRYRYDMNLRDTVYTELGVNAGWRPVLPAGWEDSSSAFLAAGDPLMQRGLLGQLACARTTIIDTIKFYIDSMPGELMETLGRAHFVSLNEAEARELARTPSIARAGRTLLAAGPRGVIIKLGEYGAAFASEDDYFVAAGYPLEEVIDPTGAGDAFAGGFLGYLDTVEEVNTAAIRRAIIYGSTVASFDVEGFGAARLLTLRREEVEARYREFRALTHFEVLE